MKCNRGKSIDVNGHETIENRRINVPTNQKRITFYLKVETLCNMFSMDYCVVVAVAVVVTTAGDSSLRMDQVGGVTVAATEPLRNDRIVND